MHAEQGLGDAIQFIRYASLVKQRGGTVIVECHAPLVDLLAGVSGIDQVFPHLAALPRFDVQSPLLSLPGIFHTDLSNIPAVVPYIDVDPQLIQTCKEALDRPSGAFQVGIAWQGNPSFPGDRQRSIPLTQFGRLA